MAHDKRSILLASLVAVALALAGCAGGDGGGDSTTTSTTTGTTTGTATTTGTGTGAPDDETPPPRYENVTLGQSLSDCTVVQQLVSGGAPAEPPNGVAELSLTEVDWGRAYTIELTSEASDGTAPSALCVGFEGVGSLQSGESGTIPAEAETMYIGGDFVYEGTVFVTIG